MLALVEEFPLAVPLGIIAFVASIAFLYFHTRKKAAELLAA